MLISRVVGGSATEARLALQNPAAGWTLWCFTSGCHQPKIGKWQVVTQATVPLQIIKGRDCIILLSQIPCRIVVIEVKRNNGWTLFFGAWGLVA
jgi:hypothetical protein